MARRLVILAFVALASWGMSCRENRPDGEQRSPATGVAAPSAQPDARDSGRALHEANEVVEAARILAVPLQPLGDEVIQGMALPTYTELPDLTYDQMLSRIAATGATHVSVVVAWGQQTIHHNRIRPEDTTPSDERIGGVIDAAHRAGLRVMVFPILHVQRRNTGEWRGKLAPTKPERWKADYEAFIGHYAELAAAHKAEILCVGSELSSLESDTDWWTTVIASTRGRFPGKLIYSANWDHYETPKFWHLLDYIGVSSYFEVGRRPDEPIFRLTERWQKHRTDMVEFATATGKPVILTEVGYPSVDSAAVKPWDYTAKSAPNPNAQLAAFRSLADTWTQTDETSKAFGGLFIWHGWGHGGPDDLSYPIWGKSSERLIRSWYGGPTP